MITQNIFKLKNPSLSRYKIHQSLSEWLGGTERILFCKNNDMLTVQGENIYIPAHFAGHIKTNNFELKNGDKIEFYCQCNPTKRSAKSGHIVGLPKRELSWWFRRKLEDAADVLDVMVFYSAKLEIYLQCYDCCVLLKVKDAEKFEQILRDGIGRSKYAGFGLMRIER